MTQLGVFIDRDKNLSNNEKVVTYQKHKHVPRH